MDVFSYPGLWEGLSTVLAALLIVGLIRHSRLRRRILRREGSGEESFRLMVDGAGEGVCLLDDSARILYANRCIAEMFGLAVGEMVGRPLFNFVDVQERGQLESRFKRARLGHDEHFELRLRKLTGRALWVLVASRLLVGADGGPVGTLWIVTDISERKERERVSFHLTERDSLTGLPNRCLLFDRIMQDIGRAYRYDLHVAVLFIDLDRFKPVNDEYGHAAGDQVLQGVAQRLNSRVRRMDTVARIGGDEFVVVLSDLASPDEVAPIAQALVDLLKEPFLAGHRECRVGASIGISIFPEDGRASAELLEKADAAMYVAKQAGGGRFCRYSGG